MTSRLGFVLRTRLSSAFFLASAAFASSSFACARFYGTVEIALQDLLDDRPEKIALIRFAPKDCKACTPARNGLIFSQEPVEMMEEYPVEDGSLRMAWTIDSRHIGNPDSRSMPGAPKMGSGGRVKDPSTNGWPQVGLR